MNDPRLGAFPTLTDAEKEALEHAIGVGTVELGEDISGDLESACRKLTLNPINWHGDRILKSPG